MSQTLSVPHVTRYRVTLDFTVDDSNCVPPSNWKWNELLQLKSGERVKDVYVENLGQIAKRSNKNGRGNRGKK